MKFWYKFKILRGYTFESEIILTEYVDKIYSLKSSVSPVDLSILFLSSL